MAKLTFQLYGAPLEVEAPLPAGTVTAAEFLPLVHAVVSAVVARSAERVEAGIGGLPGKPITCAKGCAACCKRQPVPTALPEAEALRSLVDRQAPARREELRARFEATARCVEESGLGPRMRMEIASTPEQARAAVQEYMQLELVCPFLENESCSIYENRPMACRMYLVTSPASLCTDPLGQPVEVLSMPLRPITALMAALEELGASAQHTVPLTLAVPWADAHREAAEQQYSAELLLKTWLKHLSRRNAPGAAGTG